MVESVNKFFAHLLRPGNMGEYSPGGVNLENLKALDKNGYVYGRMPDYDGVEFPDDADVLCISQILKFVKVESQCQLNLFSVDADDYLEIIFLQSGYSDKDPFISFLHKTGDQTRYKYSTEFSTEHRTLDTGDVAPGDMSNLQKDCYEFMLNELDKYSFVKVDNHGEVSA